MVNACFSYCIIGLFWYCMWPYHLLLFILQRTEHRCLQRPRESGFFSIEHNGMQQKKPLAIDLPCHLQLLPPQCVYFLCLHRIVDSVCRWEQSVCFTVRDERKGMWEQSKRAECLGVATLTGWSGCAIYYLQVFLKGQDCEFLVLHIKESFRKPPDLRDDNVNSLIPQVDVDTIFSAWESGD